MREMKRARAPRLAGDPVALDQVEDAVGRGGERGVERLARDRTEPRGHRVGRQPQPGIDEAHVAPRTAIAHAPGLEQDHLGPLLGRAQRRRKPGIAAADDGEIGAALALQVGGGEPLLRAGLPEGGRIFVIVLFQSITPCC